MKHSLMFKSSCSMSTFTVRACGWKASSTVSVFEAAQRLIVKMYDYSPIDLEVINGKTPGVFHATWTELKKEAA